MSPAPVHELLQRAELAMDQGLGGEAERLCREAMRIDPAHAGAGLLLGDVLLQLGRTAEAELTWRKVVLGDPDCSEAWSALAMLLLDQLRWDEARRLANRALREDCTNGEAAYVRAVLRERSGDQDGARRDYLRAARSAPDIWPIPTPLPVDQVEEVVAQALAGLHPALRAHLANTPIILEDVPSRELLEQLDPPPSPVEILGTCSGPSLLDRSIDDPWSMLPGAIVIFRRNIERFARSREELVEQLRITLFHEIGHFLGLDEQDLARLGLD